MRVPKRGVMAVAAVALVASACGGSGDGSATQATVDAAVNQQVNSALGSSTTGASSTTTPAQPTSMEQWEALWADQRAAMVKKIKDNHWGKSTDGKTVTGPDGFTIDLSKCPAGWSDTEGLSDDSIKIGLTLPQSGTAADYGNIARAMVPLYNYYSEKGAFKDSAGKTRKLNLLARDDSYDVSKTIPLTDELIDSEKVFAQWTLGSPNGLKVYDKLNQRCIPHPFEMVGHPAWGDPVNHPWTTGMSMSYFTEGILWGAFIDQHIGEFGGDKVRVAALVNATDFGKAYDIGFRAYLQQSPNKARIEYVTESIESQAPTVTDPMTTLASKNPNVFIAMIGGTQCTQVITEIAQNGMKEKVKYPFISGNCKASTFLSKAKVGGDGSASEGWWVVGGGVKDINDPNADSDPFLKFARQLLVSNGLDPKASSSLGTGFYFGWPMVQALQTAGQLDGGLTRTNLMVTLRSFNMTHPWLLPGIGFNTSGNRDAYFVEGSEISRWSAAKQGWEKQGDVIDLSGKSKPCSWDQAAALCR